MSTAHKLAAVTEVVAGATAAKVVALATTLADEVVSGAVRRT